MDTVLIVDDDPDDREMVQAFLEMNGCSVACAADGHEALKLLEGTPDAFCIVLLDIMMPIMSGFEVLEAMREKPELTKIPVVFVSAATDLSEPAKQWTRQFLKKPIDLDGLLTVVDEFCSC